MPAHPRRHLVFSALLVLSTILAMVLAVAGPVTAQSIEEAREEKERIQAELDEATARFGELEARATELEDEAASLQAEMDELAARAADAEERVSRQVRDLYMHGVDAPVLQVLGGQDPGAVIERIELATHLVTADRADFEQANASRIARTELAELLGEREEELAGVREEMEATLAALGDDLDRAQALEERLVREEEERRREAERRAAERRATAEAAREREAAASEQSSSGPTETTPEPAPEPEPEPEPDPPPSSGGLACPMGNPHSFTDTWGAPRSGGRSHKGVDIMANYGTPIYAIVSGVWDIQSYGNSAGNWAILRGDNGHQYWYMHLQSFTVGDGAHVSAGTQTGTNGATGNAPASAPHLHFEYHPYGGGAVNPTPLAREAC